MYINVAGQSDRACLTAFPKSDEDDPGSPCFHAGTHLIDFFSCLAPEAIGGE